MLKVDLCHKLTARRTALEKKIKGLSSRDDSTIICFEDDEVFVPKGFNCSIQLQILEKCWYKKLLKPPTDKYYSDGGQLLLTDVSFEVTGAGDKIPDLCPISRLFIMPISDVDNA